MIERYCARCGTPIMAGPPSKVYCSRRCQRRAHERRRQKRLTVERRRQRAQEQTICDGCGGHSRRGKWCSQFCKDLAMHKYVFGPRPAACITCEAPITQGKRVRLFCSRGCNPKQASRARTGFSPSVADCENCGRSFLVETINQYGRRRFCGPDCKHEFGNRRRRHPSVMEPYDRQAIFDRDGWRCRLCGRSVNRGHRWPHPLSASIDHIIPLSLGGADVPANVQLAHLTCNLSKGARAQSPEQLRLIG